MRHRKINYQEMPGAIPDPIPTNGIFLDASLHSENTFYHGRINTEGTSWRITTHPPRNTTKGSRRNRYNIPVIFATPDPKLAIEYAKERQVTDEAQGDVELYRIWSSNPEARLIDVSVNIDRSTRASLEPEMTRLAILLENLNPSNDSESGQSTETVWDLFFRNPTLLAKHLLLQKNTLHTQGPDGYLTTRFLDLDFAKRLIGSAGIVGSFARTSTRNYTNLPTAAFFDLPNTEHRQVELPN